MTDELAAPRGADEGTNARLSKIQQQTLHKAVSEALRGAIADGEINGAETDYRVKTSASGARVEVASIQGFCVSRHESFSDYFDLHGADIQRVEKALTARGVGLVFVRGGA